MMKAMVVVAAGVFATGCSQVLTLEYGRSRSPHARRGEALAPLPVGRWDIVMRLPRGSTIDVLTSDGVPKVGGVARADAQSVTVHVSGQEVRIPKSEIVRVDLVDLAGSDGGAVARSAARGALLGAGAAALTGAIVGGPLWPPPGALVRAGAAVGAVSAGETAILARRGRMIYLSSGQP